MKLPPSRWMVVPAPPGDRVGELARVLNIPEPLAQLLVQRGYTSHDRAREFLRPSLSRLSDPYELRDMEAAVAAVSDAVRSGHPIMVHGDYDVDGQCATALLTRALRHAGARVIPFIPHRLRDGYDLGPAGVAAAVAQGARLIITVDCGTTARESVRAAKEQGMAVVITDHHLPGELPPADAVVNPRRPDCASTAGDLCGAGVAFKLVQALVPALELPENLPLHFLDLVAVATVADVVPLTGENRILVRFGLRKLAETRWPGLRALLDVSGLAGRPVRAGHVGFVLGPRLNAAGRIGDAMDGLRLLLSDDEAEARELARRLETLNARRQEMDQEILDQAIETVEQTTDPDRDYGLVLAREGWHPGVIGIVASRIVERYGRPTIMVALEGDEGKGSGRSIARFDLHAALTQCAPHLSRFGGHRMAAGLTISRNRLDAFREAFNQTARAELTPDDLVPTQRVDVVVRLENMDVAFERLLRHLEPCGPGNPTPVFGLAGAVPRDPQTVGTNHLRLVLDDGGERIKAIGFGWADRADPSWWRGQVDAAFRLERDDWRGEERLQARLVQLKPTA